MEISRTTPNHSLPVTHGTLMNTALRERGAAIPMPQENTAAPRPPTMIDLAAARSLTWLMNHLLHTIGADLEFTVQTDSGEIVVRVLDKATGDLIRHIPAEALPDVAAVLAHTHGGLIEETA